MYQVSSQSIEDIYSKDSMMGVILPSLRRQRLLEFTNPSDTLSYKPFFKYYILQTIVYLFLLFMFV